MSATLKRDEGRASAPRVLRAKPRAAEARPEALFLDDAFVATSHGKICVRQSIGQGLPVVFLHGNSSGKEVFAPQFESPLAKRYRMVALDLPGHGSSSDALEPERTYSIPGYADATLETLEALDIKEAVLVGWSLGGHVALELSTRFPGVLGVLLIGTPPIAPQLKSLQQAFKPHPLAGLVGSAQLSDEQIAQFTQGALGVSSDAEAEALVRRSDGRARELMFMSLVQGAFADERRVVETSSFPIAVVLGAEDPLVSSEYVEGVRFANLWSGSRHLIPRAGHAPFRNSPDIFNNLLSKFLSDAAAR